MAAASTDFLAAHFGDDQESLRAFLQIQEDELRIASDAAYASELAEGYVCCTGLAVAGPAGSGPGANAGSLESSEDTPASDLQAAMKLSAQEEARQRQLRHDMDFACQIDLTGEDEWEDSGDLMEKPMQPARDPPGTDLYVVEGECMVCLETDAFVMILPCTHRVCKGCLKQYLKMQVQERKVPIFCCNHECEEQISVDMVERVAGPESADRHRHSLAVATMKNPVNCPTPDCGMVLDCEPGTQHVSCTECRISFCASCRVRWHMGMSCDEFQDLPVHHRAPEDVEFLRLAREKRWQTCPSCGNMVAKEDGDCNFMKCRCGAPFCFQCGEQYVNEEEQAANVHGKARCACPLFGEDELDESDDDEEQVARAREFLEGLQQYLNAAPHAPHPHHPPPPEWHEVGGEYPHHLYPGQHQHDFEVPHPHHPYPGQHPEHPYAPLDMGPVGVHPPAPLPARATQRFVRDVDLLNCEQRQNLDNRGRPLPDWLLNCMDRSQCYYCAREFPHLGALTQHLQDTGQHPVFACCGRIFKTHNSLCQHQNACHY